MRIVILVLFLMSVAYAQTPPIEPGVSQELAKWRAARYSDVRYKLNLTLEKMSPVLKGTIEVRVKVRDAGTVREGEKGRGGDGELGPIVLDWRKIKGHEDRSRISNVSINGSVLSPRVSRPSSQDDGGNQNTFEESNEHLVFRDGVVAGENVIKLDFTSPILTSGSAITRYVDKEDGAEYIYSLFVPSDASTAFPVFDQPDLKARFEASLWTPGDWTVISNSKMSAYFPIHEGGLRGTGPGALIFNLTSFEETKPISTYVFAFAAGPWQQVSEPRAVATSGRNPTGREGANPKSKIENPKSEDTLPTGRVSASTTTSIYVRKSQLAKFQPHAAEVFRLNREGIKFLEEYFDYKFPFPKYDIVLIPEFPFGGMEHAGATFLRESSVIFPSEPTANDYISRANVIFHEAAHQWFGDTVTMKWFDDLWLKEGFAEFMAYKTLEKVMPEYNAWKVFYERNKQAAYLTDSTKGTTPIYQEIANLSAAKSAYGNIVYRKAPSFLKQAEFYIGSDKFRIAVRAFLKKHEFGNAGWEELVGEFEKATGSELTEWARTWIRKPGLPIYRGNRVVSAEGAQYTLTKVNDLDAKNFWLQRIEVWSGNTSGTSGGNDHVIGGSRVAMRKIWFDNTTYVFPNEEDYGYGIFLLDDKSRDYVLKNIQNEKDDFLRSMMWGSLWDSVREGELDPKEYVELAIKNVGLEKDESTIQTILARVSTAMTYYSSEPRAVATGSPRTVEATKGNPVATAPGSDLSIRLESMLIDKMRTAPTLGQRITFYRAFLNIASTQKARNVLKQVLATGGNPTGREGVSESRAPKNTLPTGRVSVYDLPLKTKDRFDIVSKLASLGDPDAEKLLADLEKTETSDDGKRYAYAARAAFPTKATKEKYWNDFTTNKDISESWIEAAFGPFNSVRHADLTLPYLEKALNELPNHKRNRKIFFVNGWLGAFIGGQRSERALAIVNKFLADNPNLDKDLRLKILENVDLIERAVKIARSMPNDKLTAPPPTDFGR